MLTYFRSLSAIVVFLVGVASSQAQVKTTVEVNRDNAQAAFKFDSIPLPSATDAGNIAKLSLAGGRLDGNGGQLDVLRDGAVPGDSDDPRNNLFLAQGSRGGRLLFDFSEPIEVQRVISYSWHRSTRGPQVYKLYAGNPAADGFQAEVDADTDLSKAGWKLLAEVDTRPAERNDFGGQYAVSIADESNAKLGSFRYLLFDVAATETDDPFGNTFVSEIDILDGREHEPPPEPEGIDLIKIGDDYEIVFDTRQTPDLRRWVDEKLKPICIEWYPKIIDMLPSEGYEAPQKFTIIFHADMGGVANAGGGRINCAASWFRRNLNGEAPGAVVHEMVHIAQQYRGRRGNRNPSWMVEGVADYIRWFYYEPERNRPRVNANRANYDDSYRTTAAFLYYVAENHEKDIVKKFNADMRQGNYSEDSWETYTGKTVQTLWDEFIESLED